MQLTRKAFALLFLAKCDRSHEVFKCLLGVLHFFCHIDKCFLQSLNFGNPAHWFFKRLVVTLGKRNRLVLKFIQRLDDHSRAKP